MVPTHGLVTHGVLSGQGLVYSLAGNLVSVLARREWTGGAYGLIEAIVPPGVGAPMHTHSREDEAFYVIEGELGVRHRRNEGHGGVRGLPPHAPGPPPRLRQLHERAGQGDLRLHAGGLRRLFRGGGGARWRCRPGGGHAAAGRSAEADVDRGQVRHEHHRWAPSFVVS